MFYTPYVLPCNAKFQLNHTAHPSRIYHLSIYIFESQNFNLANNKLLSSPCRRCRRVWWCSAKDAKSAHLLKK